MSIDKKAFGLSDSLIAAVSEALKGGQVKIDKNHNGKIDGQDFKILRKEEVVDEGNPANKAKKNAAAAAVGAKHDDEHHTAKRGMRTDVADKIRGREVMQGKPRVRYEEVEQIDELSRKTLISYGVKADAQLHKVNALGMGTKVSGIPGHYRGKNKELGKDPAHKVRARKAGAELAWSKASKMRREEVQYVEEKLTKDDPASKWIHDFVHSDNPKFAGKSKSERQKQALGAYYAKQRNEEVEQVDELSKATLGSYIKKAATDVATNSAATGRHAERSNKIADHQKKTGDYSHENQRRKDSKTADKAFDKSWKRRQGINKATDKLTKEDVQVDEVLDTNIKKFAYLMKAKKSINKSDPNDMKQANDIANRTIGVKRLIKKVTKKKVSEGVEQVDELSKATLGSYVNKSAASLGKAGYNAGSTDGTAAKLDPHIHTINKRSTGIKRAVGKLAKEDTQIDEISTDTYHKAAHKAAKRAMGDAQGRSGPIFKKYAGMANKFRDKGMSQEKKEKAMKEETLDEIQGVYGNGGNKKNLKIIHKGVVVKDYGTDTKPNKATRDKKAEKMKAYRAERDKNMEEEIQIDEISKKLAARYNNKVGPIINKNQNSGGDPAKLLKRKNREAGHKLSWNKYHNYKVKVPATEETDPGFAEAAENPMAKQLADKKAAIQKTIVQKKMQVMQAKANKQISSMKEGKCTCAEGKKSMSCEVCNDKAKGIKGGKEPIQMNPPLRD